MAVRVAEIMNHELFAARPDDRASETLALLVALGVSAAPVLGDDQRPLGFVALRDLASAPEGAHVLVRMTAPVESIAATATIQEAATMMTERSRHHLVCVDAEGRAVGFVGTLDVLRGLMGQPVPHPRAFPHFDPKSGLVWSDEAQLTFAEAERAPAMPGVFVLIDAAPGKPNRVVWSESTGDLRKSLRDLLERPGDAPPHLMDAAICGRLWCRYAQVSLALPRSTTSASG
jgi:CBS domain-containing protein